MSTAATGATEVCAAVVIIGKMLLTTIAAQSRFNTTDIVIIFTIRSVLLLGAMPFIMGRLQKVVVIVIVIVIVVVLVVATAAAAATTTVSAMFA